MKLFFLSILFTLSFTALVFASTEEEQYQQRLMYLESHNAESVFRVFLKMFDYEIWHWEKIQPKNLEMHRRTAETLLMQTGDTGSMIRLRLLLSDYYCNYQPSDAQNCLKYAALACSLAEETRFDSLLGDCYAALANAYMLFYDYEKLSFYAEKALSEKKLDPRRRPDCLLAQYLSYENQKLPLTGLCLLWEARQQVKNDDIDDMLIFRYSYALAYALQAVGASEKAVQILQEFLPQLEKNTMFYMQAWLLTGQCYNELRQPKETVKACQKALSAATVLGLPGQQINASAAILEAALEIPDRVLAKENVRYLQTVAFDETEEHLYYLDYANLQLGKWYRIQNAPFEADASLKLARKIAEKIGDTEMLKEIKEELSRQLWAAEKKDEAFALQKEVWELEFAAQQKVAASHREEMLNIYENCMTRLNNEKKKAYSFQKYLIFGGCFSFGVILLLIVLCIKTRRQVPIGHPGSVVIFQLSHTGSAPSVGEINAVFAKFNEIMTHFHCTGTRTGRYGYVAVCHAAQAAEYHAANLAKAALMCLQYLQRCSDNRFFLCAGMDSGVLPEVNAGSRNDPTAQKALQILQRAGDWQLAVSSSARHLLSRKFKCTRQVAGSRKNDAVYLVEGVFRSEK